MRHQKNYAKRWMAAVLAATVVAGAVPDSAYAVSLANVPGQGMERATPSEAVRNKSKTENSAAKSLQRKASGSDAQKATPSIAMMSLNEIWGERAALELENGKILDPEQSGNVRTQSLAGFSGGKYVDNLNAAGVGAGVAVYSDNDTTGYYRVSLQYARGSMVNADGRVGFYVNDQKAGDFTLKKGDVNKTRLSEDIYIVKLNPGDKLSVLAEEGNYQEDAVGRLDCLFLERWGGMCEAEDAEVMKTEDGEYPAVTSKSGASGGKIISKFVDGVGSTASPHVGSGVAFPGLAVPEDDTYQLKICYMRSGDYEYSVEPSLYINDVFSQTVDLTAKENTDTFYTISLPELELTKGDIISLRIDGQGTMKADFGLDYISLDVAETEIKENKDIAFYDNAFRVLKGATFSIPIVNEQEAETVDFVYSTDNQGVADVDENNGLITVKAEGTATITAKAGQTELTAVVEVVSAEENLFPDVKTYEAEEQELLLGYGNKKLEKTIYAPDNWLSPYFFPGGYVSKFGSAGDGAGIRFKTDGIQKGIYDLALRYSIRDMVGTSLTVFVNNKEAGIIDLAYTPQDSYPGAASPNWAPTVSVPLSVPLESGDTVEIKAVEDNAKPTDGLWLDSVKLAPHFTIVPTAIEVEREAELAVSENKTISVKTKPTQKPKKEDGLKWVLWNRTASEAVIWSSSSSDIAEVDNGFISAKAEGKATLTVSSLFDEDVSASCAVKVVKNEKLTELKNEAITVTLDKTFPRVIQYQINSSKSVLAGCYKKLDTVKINDKDYKPAVSYKTVSDSEASYDLAVQELDAVIHVTVKVEDNLFKMDITDIEENGGDEKRVFTIEFPGLDIVSASNNEEGAQFAGANLITRVTDSGDTIIDLYENTKEDASPIKYAYAFLSNGKVAAGVRSNAVGSDRIVMGDAGSYHLNKQTVAEGSSLRTGLSSIPWVWRRSDYTKKFQDIPNRYPDEHVTENGIDNMVNKVYKSEPEAQKPLLHVALSEDINEDEKVDWQDGAVAYRAIMHHVKDEEKVPDMVVQRLVQQQANSGNYPFISMLDETRRVSLNTDNLGQMINDKFHNEAYWGDFTHYDDHLGGWRDFKYMVDESTEKYNGYVGVHSNFYEYFAKVEQFSPELTSMKEDGVTPNNKGYKAYGAWLHQCYNIDTTADTLSGDRLRRMKIFKEDIPNLGFIYNDVWYNTGWEGRRIGEDYRNADIGYCVEWPYANFEDAIWSHWAVERGYGGVDLKGIMSDIMRFVWNHTRDRWDNNDHPTTAGRTANARNLLMGADTTTYEGWQNYAGSTNRYDRVMQKIFEDNLPTKFMQHFPIVRMDKDEEGWASHIWFEDGVEAYYENGDPWNRIIAVKGNAVYTPDKFLIPWDDGALGGSKNLAGEPDKFYHWNKEDGDSTWTLPADWTGKTVYLYELSDQGKKNEQVLTVSGDGQVTLTGVKKNIPYVLYGEQQQTGNEEARFGEGGYVKDPGFNYGDLRKWQPEYGTPEVKRNYSAGDDKKYVIDAYGGELRNYELIMEGPDAASVSQKIEGLTPGESYAATVMVEVEQGHRRKAVIEAECGGTKVQNYTDSSPNLVTDIYDSKANTYMQRMRVEFTVPAGADEAVIRLMTEEDPSGDPAIVRFDNLRVYDCTVKSSEPYAPKNHADGTPVTGKIISYQDFENTKRKEELIQSENGRDALKTEFEVFYPLVMGQGQFDASNNAQQYRSFLMSRHEPYTQNGLDGSQWDPNTTGTDDVLAGERSLRIYGAPLGIAFQTMPQTVRFKAGRTYRVSFLYEYRKEREGDMEFVIGDGQIPRADSHDPAVGNIKEHIALPATSPAATEETRIGKFFYEFTSPSDDAWIGFNRAVYFDMWEDPCPFQVDNLLIEDISGAEEPEETLYTLKVEAAGHGSVTVTDEKEEFTVEEGAEKKIPEGTMLKVTAAPEDGYEVKSLKINGALADIEQSFKINRDTVVSVEFGLISQGLDTKEILKLIVEAETKKETEYTSDSWNIFADKLEQARQTFENAVSQEELDKAAEELKTAMDNLKKAEDKPEPEPKPEPKPEPEIQVVLPEGTGFSQEDIIIEGIEEALGLSDLLAEGKNVKLSMTLKPEKEAHQGDVEKLEGALRNESQIVKVFDISLELNVDGRKKPVNKSMVKEKISFTISLQEPLAADKSYEVWHVPSDGGKPEKLESKLSDDRRKVTFWMDDFSTVAITEKTKASSSHSSSGGTYSPNTRKAAGTWKQDAAGWWYDKGNGKYDRSSWAMIQGKWYYFDESGYMKTGWILLGNKWYYLRQDKDSLEGSMVTGWNLIHGTWYYMEADGSMAANRWIQGQDGKWYYVQSDGSMAKDKVIDGKYRVDEFGVWIP